MTNVVFNNEINLEEIVNAYVEQGANSNAEEFLYKRAFNNAVALRAEKKDPTRVLDLSQAANLVGSLGKLGYVPGSKISLIISKTCICEALKDMELNKQFLGEDGKIDMFKLAAVFPYVGTEATTEGYVRIFSEAEFKEVVDKGGRKQRALNACKDRIHVILQRIREFKGGTQEDLVLLGKDLEIVATVMSELEIDAAKDENKRLGMIKIEEFMNIRLQQRGRQINIINNFDDMISYKNGYTPEIVSKLVYEIKEEITFFDFERVCEKRIAEFFAKAKETGKVLTEAESKDAVRNIKKAVREECMVVDPLFQIVEMMLEAVKDTLDKFAVFYMNSDMKLFEDLFITAQRDEEENIVEGETLEEAIASVRKTAVIVYEMINNTFAYGKSMSMAKPSDIASMGRNIIYTAGAIRGFSEEDTFLMAVDAGWYRRSVKNGKAGLSKAKNFKYKAVEMVFGTELKYYFNSDAMRKEAKLEIPQELLDAGLFYEGIVLEFEDGQCEIDLTDDDSYSILRVDDIHYTGSILLEVDEEGYAVFVEDVNQYEFEVVDYVVFDNIADANHRLDIGAFEALFVEAETTDGVFAKEYAKYRLVPKTKSEDNGGYILSDAEKAEEAKRITPILNKWENTVELECSAGLICSIEQDHYCINGQKGGAILGKVHDSFLQEDEYKQIFSYSTAVGAIIVKEPVEEMDAE